MRAALVLPAFVPFASGVPVIDTNFDLDRAAFSTLAADRQGNADRERHAEHLEPSKLVVSRPGSPRCIAEIRGQRRDDDKHSGGATTFSH